MGILLLLAQCVTMFIASFLAGSLPLMFKSATQGKRLKAISVIGMGLLVGAALTIIVPEGISTLYGSLPTAAESSQEDREDREAEATRAVGLSLLSGFALMLIIESLIPHPPHPEESSPCSSPPSPSSPISPLPPSHHSPSDSRPHPTHLNSSTPIIPKHMHIHDGLDCADFGSRNGHNGQWGGSGLDGLNATLGLVIHGAADGIALGASSLSGRGSLGLIVFLAVLIHKGPTALGLTTTLLSLSLTPPQIRKRLLIFSFAAPIGAIVTYMVVSTFGGQSMGLGSSKGSVDGLGWWTGIALLFSGGSFLYVATVIQPLSSSDEHHHPPKHSHDAESVRTSEPGDNEPLGKFARTGLLMLGMVSPVVLVNLIGSHKH